MPGKTTDGRIFVGPAGWCYADWEGTVYPPGVTRSGKRLEYILRRFNLVEIDATFYRVPPCAHAERWARTAASTGAPFRFTVKAPGALTHEGLLDDHVVRPFRGILDTLRNGGVLGAVLFQFPASFRCEKVEKVRLKRILDAFEGYPAAVEVRHRGWDIPPFLDYLRSRGVAFCNIDQPDTGDHIEVGARVTAPRAYLRLHGRNRDAWVDPGAGRDARFDWLYGPEDVARFAVLAREMAARTEEVYVVTNNHYRGKAIVNAGELAAALGGSGGDPGDLPPTGP